MSLPRGVDLKQVGRRIALQRTYLGWSQTTLAKQTGAKQTQISEWERGAGISEENLKRLADELGTSVKFLLFGVDPTIDTILLRETPSDYFSDLRGATKLWIAGLNLGRIIPNNDSIIAEICTKPNAQVRVLLLDPNDENACRYGAAQEYGDASSWEKYKSTIDVARDFFEDFKAATLQLKLVRYPLGFGLDIVNFSLPDSFLYVRHYPVRNARLTTKQGELDKSKISDQPIMKLNSRTPEHQYWYEFYVKQFLTIWDMDDNGWP
jgi:transcriptional regulator with XRE-family HTH domain